MLLRGRRLAHRLPHPVQRVLQGAYRSVRATPVDTGPQLSYPADVADAAALRRMLAETDLFGPEVEEAAGYLADGLERFRITMALLPELSSGAPVLELGANPYFITRLLLARGLDVTCANWFGEAMEFDSREKQVVVESGIEHVYEFDHFNVETDRFPYDDDSFDVVLFCEIIEHLPNDPVQTLAEIHRVLRPGGTMVLTTPNAVRLDRLICMIEGRNVYESLSGYGTYGRHNREYTVAELELLLAAANFEVEQVFASDIGHPPPPVPLGPGVSTAERGENLFAVAHPTGEPRWRYPDWLYTSTHVLSRLVRPELVMGINCDLQCAGFHYLEQVGGTDVRWTGREAESVVLVEAPGGRARLRIEGIGPHRAAGDAIVLDAAIGDERASWTVPCDGEPFVVEADLAAEEGENEVVLTTDRTWRPVDVGLSDDRRRIGVLVARVSLRRAVPGARNAGDRPLDSGPSGSGSGTEELR